MDRSPYLARAIQEMQAAPAVSGQAPDFAALQAMAKQIGGTRDARAAFEAANPGQSYMRHQIGQMGRNLMGAPQRAAQGLMALVPGGPAAPR